MTTTTEENFKRSKKIYDKFIEENNERPTETEWNRIAKEQFLLSSVSMRYIGKITFKKRIF